MVDSVQWAEWFVEKVVVGHSLGNTTLVLVLNLLAVGYLLSLPQNLDRSDQAVGAKQPGACRPSAAAGVGLPYSVDHQLNQS